MRDVVVTMRFGPVSLAAWYTKIDADPVVEEEDCCAIDEERVFEEPHKERGNQ